MKARGKLFNLQSIAWEMKQDEVINISTSQKKSEDEITKPQVDLLWLNRM